MTVQMPDIYAQLRHPGTELAVRAYRLSHQSTPEFVFNHSVRSYLFAEALAGTRNLRPGTDYDQELLATTSRPTLLNSYPARAESR